MTKKQIKKIQDLCAGVEGAAVFADLDSPELANITVLETLQPCPYCGGQLDIIAHQIDHVRFNIKCNNTGCPSMPTVFGKTLRQAINNNNHRVGAVEVEVA